MSRNYYEPPRAGLTDKPDRPTLVEVLGRWLLVPLAAMAALPMTFILVPYYFAWKASLYIGHWPYFNNPDPKDLPEEVTASINYPVFIIVSFIVMTVMITSLEYKFVRPRWRLWVALTTLVGCWVLAFALLAIDPFGVMAWIMD